MPVKIYHLLPHTDSSAPIYRRVNKDQRVRLQKRPVDHAFLQITFTEAQDPKSDVPPKNRTLRLKMNSNYVFQDEQIKTEGILANVPFTSLEKDAVMFKNGVLITKYEIVQRFLDAHPQNKKFQGLCDSIKQPLFEEYNQSAKTKAGNEEFNKRVDAAVKIKDLDNLKDAQDLMYRLNGFYFKAPEDLEECRAGLISFLDDADEDGLDKILDDTLTKDEEIRILVGKAIAKELISFSAKQHQVSIKKNNAWVDVKMISSDLAGEERQRLFIEFLSTKEGNILYEDLKTKVEGEKKDKKKTKEAEPV